MNFLQIGDTVVRNESEATTWQETIENGLKIKLGFQINSGDQVSKSWASGGGGPDYNNCSEQAIFVFITGTFLLQLENIIIK